MKPSQEHTWCCCWTHKLVRDSNCGLFMSLWLVLTLFWFLILFPSYQISLFPTCSLLLWSHNVWLGISLISLSGHLMISIEVGLWIVSMERSFHFLMRLYSYKYMSIWCWRKTWCIVSMGRKGWFPIHEIHLLFWLSSVHIFKKMAFDRQVDAWWCFLCLDLVGSLQSEAPLAWTHLIPSAGPCNI